MIRRLDTAHTDFEAAFARLIDRESLAQTKIDARVARIIADVRAAGDAAVLGYTRELDRHPAEDMAAGNRASTAARGAGWLAM